MQPEFEVGTAGPREVLRPPFDVEDPVGSSATYRCEYAKPTIDQIQVVPVWQDGVVVVGPRQARVGKGRIGCRELGIAVGGQIDACVSDATEVVRERQRDSRHRIITVIADIGCARDNAVAALVYSTTTRHWRRCRRWCRCGSRAGRWCGGWRRQRNVSSCLNSNNRRRAGLKVAYRRVGWVGRLIGIKPEVVQRAEANRVGVLILRKSFRVPRDRARVLGNTPRSVAISQAHEGAIICEGGMLRRGMKSDVRDVHPGSNRHAERLDRAIEVLVVESIFIVPDAGTRVRDFVAHEPDAIGSRVRLLSVYRRASPSHDGRLFSHGGSCAGKTKGLINSGYGVRTVRSVVIHVALARMTLAPGVFVRDDVFRFGKIRRSWVQRRVQVVNVDQNSVSGYVMTMATVIVGC